MPKAGDYLLFLILLAFIAGSFHFGRQHLAAASSVQIRQNGVIVAELPLRLDREFITHGPLGESRIEVRDGKVRIAQDPGARQYCVQQGWLTRAGEMAICLPNRLTIELRGQEAQHDSLSY